MGRNHAPVHVGSRELREVFAEPFAAAIRDADLASVMNSYSSVDGLAPAGSRALLTELLRDELGFNGTVVADYFAVDLLRTHHRVAPTKGVAAAKALLAGMDQELPTLDCYAELPPLVDGRRRARGGGRPVGPSGAAPQVRARAVRGAVRRRATPPQRRSAHPTARALARRAAVESLVLLDDATGSSPSTRRRWSAIAVIGPGGGRPAPARG